MEYTKLLKPLYTPPNRKKISEIMLPRKYEELRGNVMGVLNSVFYLAITTDLSSERNIFYITVTSQFTVISFNSVRDYEEVMHDAAAGSFQTPGFIPLSYR